jgi:uncharacterized protein YgiM (DUF1202 family)
MKRLSFILVQLLIVLSGFAQTGVKYASVKLNLREDASVSSQVITVIPQGTPVTMAEDSPYPSFVITLPLVCNEGHPTPRL